MERNVPKLRFKGFNDEWKKEVISSICKLSSGSTPSKARKEYFNGTHLWVTSGELKNKYIYNTIDKITDKAIKNTNLKEYEIGSFIIAIYGLEAQGTRGSSAILGRKATISQACMAIEPVKDIYSEFLYYWYAKYGDMIGIRYAQGTKQQNLSTDLVGNLKIIFPSLKEQERITNFLTKVDKIIEKQDEKVKNLEKYKKGMMQKIFSQEIRFKDENGEEYPEWEEKRLKEITIVLDNMRKPLSANERQEIKGHIPYYGANGIVDYIDDYIFDERLILLAEDGGNFDEFASKPIAQIIDGKTWVNNHAHVLRTINSYVDYIFYTLVHKDIRKYINGTSRAKLNQADMLEIVIPFPCLEEQIKIANFLDKIYLLIVKESIKLEELRQWKKGLLQQMFV